MAMTDPERIPVIIGVGQINDRPADPDQGMDSLGLMVAALRAAEMGCDALLKGTSVDGIVSPHCFLTGGQISKCERLNTLVQCPCSSVGRAYVS